MNKMKDLKINKKVTSRDSDAIDKYLREISHLSLINSEQETELCEHIKKGDEKALYSLVYANLRFVISVAKQYQNQGLNLSDLISEGNIGLIKAANRFDSTKGFKFISYAVWWIRQTILQAIGENARIVRLPQNKILTANKVNRTFAALYQKFEREPTVEEIAAELSISAELVKDLLESNERSTYLDSPVGNNEEEVKFIDIFVDDSNQNEFADTTKEQIYDMIKRLADREQKILRMYFGIDYPHRFTLEEIAEYFEMTRERVRQIKNNCIKKLRRSFAA